MKVSLLILWNGWMAAELSTQTSGVTCEIVCDDQRETSADGGLLLQCHLPLVTSPIINPHKMRGPEANGSARVCRSDSLNRIGKGRCARGVK